MLVFDPSLFFFVPEALPLLGFTLIDEIPFFSIRQKF